MLTVIIAEKHIIEQYEKYEMLLTPFHSQNTVFCEWNRDGNSIEEMLPSLYKLISHSKSWRAIVVNDNGKNVINPFDYVGSGAYSFTKEPVSDDNFLAQYNKRSVCLERAVENPLAKLSTALCETPLYANVIDSCEFEDIVSQKKTIQGYILSQTLKNVNTKKIVINIKRYRMENLHYFVNNDEANSFLTALCEKDISVLLKILPIDKISAFLDFIEVSNSVTADMGYWMSLLENTKKAQLFEKLRESFTLRAELPTEVLYLSPRDFDMRKHNSTIVWAEKNEEDYSKFVPCNMYSENICFLVYDVFFQKNINCAQGDMKFQTLLQILAIYGNSAATVGKNRLYNIGIEYDTKKFNTILAKYIAKLEKTAVQISEEYNSCISMPAGAIDNKVARMVFESESSIPVKLEQEYERKNLLAKHEIGLAYNCPRNEDSYWSSQYQSIKKLFIRFLREPRRAVKKACQQDFRKNNSVTDERVLRLNENQKEDILFKLNEDERAMVEIRTSSIYDTEAYMEQIHEADTELRKGIAQRMTRRKTVCVGLISALVYLFGFIPLIIGNSNTVDSVLFSLAVTGIALATFLVIGFIYLFVLRKKLVNRFLHFNYVMSGIYSEIKNSMSQFSKYLSRACDIMRRNSILHYDEHHVSKKHKTSMLLKYNLFLLNKEIDKAHSMLSCLNDNEELITVQQRRSLLPFDYDFDSYEVTKYPIFQNDISVEIDYMLAGQKVSIPIDFVNSVTVTREELYD